VSEDPQPDIVEQIAFLGLTAQDRDVLRELRPILEKNADGFVGAFYRHLLSFEPTRRMLSDPEVRDRLLDKQRGYLLSLGNPTLDEKYVQDRLEIGRAHVRVGLATRWYLGAYSLYLSLLGPMIREAYDREPERAERALSALTKLLLLDAQLAMEAYVATREEQLEHLNRELATAARKLEGEYQRRGTELRETTQRARAAEELASVATIVAGLAHEIGTPMGVIRGHAELLDSSVGDERGRWRLQTIREQIDRISSIMRTLLNIARPHTPESTLLDLRRVLDDTLAFLDERFKRRDIAVERRMVESAPLYGDGEKLQQLFLNLFLNAADAMPGGGTLSVELTRGDTGRLRVRVADTGAGMSPDALNRVFEPFYTSKPAGKGSGLGLTVAREIVHNHDGIIEVSSEVDRGTEFRIEFPGARG
jgi:signal transduction histidine kinase